MLGLLLSVVMGIASPLPGRIVYVCRGGSDELRSEWAVWMAVAERRCEVMQWEGE